MAFQAIAMALGAVGGGLSSFYGAKSRNKSIIENAVDAQEAANEDIARARLATSDRRDAAAEQFQRSFFASQSTGSFQTGAAGAASQTTAQVNDFIEDDIARQRNLEKTISNIGRRKSNIVDQASSQTVSPFAKAISGAQQGASIASSVAGGISSAASSVQTSQFVSQANQAQSAALASGFDPSILRRNPDLATSLGQNILGSQAAQTQNLVPSDARHHAPSPFTLPFQSGNRTGF